MNNKLRNWWKNIDQFTFIIIFTLLIIGIFLSFSINDSIYLVQRHLIYVFISIIIFLSLSFLEIKTIRRVALIGLIISTILMIIILLMSYEINGAKRWIRIWGLSIQPSEFLKPCFLIVSAWFLSKGLEGQKIALYIVFISFLFLTTLLILQPDFGMTLLFTAAFFCQLFIAGLSLLLIFFALLFFFLLSIISYYYFDHVQARVNMFFDSSQSYQISKSLSSF